MAYRILRPEQTAKINGVLFDMDGVILDTEKLYSRFWQEACRSLHYPMTWEQSLGLQGKSRNAQAEYLSTLFGDVDYLEIRGRMTRMMDDFVAAEGIEVKPGAGELLEYLNEKKIPCALTTSSPLDRVEEQLGRLGLLGRFDKICSAFLVEHGKPAPDIYLYGAKEIGVRPEECLALEDSYVGLLSAARAGTMNVLVPDLTKADQMQIECAYAIADSLFDVLEVLR